MPAIHVVLNEQVQQAINIVCDAALKNKDSGGLAVLNAISLIFGTVGQAAQRNPGSAPDDAPPTRESEELVAGLLAKQREIRANGKREN